jgi:hypothetical protein
VLKYWVTTLTGGAGRFVGDVADAGIGAASGKAPNLHNVPVVRKFIRLSNVSDSRQAFWQAASKAKLAAGSYRAALKARDRQAASDLMDKKGAYIKLAKMATRMAKMAASRRNEIERIKNSDYSAQKKKTLILKMEQKEKEVYDRFLEIFDSKLKE